ncbi:MAG: autotransporter outer membrane beta-barrel domain-containing protein [Verrucomicrobiales bacterium]|jgi:outer membrane autotransporter protein|nr:autotransporter outer membrane beta-barrel domain-containing protein [Verrucomicrobiales bacterium]
MKYHHCLIGSVVAFATVLLQPVTPCAAVDVYWGNGDPGAWTTGTWRVRNPNDPSGNTWIPNPPPTGADNAIVQSAPDPLTSGSVTVSAGSTGTAQNVFIGKANLGFLTIEGLLGNTNAVIGEIVGAAGSGVTVSGTGFWRNTGMLTVGRESSLTSTLTVLDTGSVSAAASIIGEIVNSSGAVTVGGNGWFNAGALTVGQSGNGGVTINGNGAVISTNATLGNAAGAHGTVSVGDHGVWRTGNFIIGNQGAGVFTLTDNASGTSASATIGANAGSTGDATVSAGATWVNSGALTVGAAGVGALTVSDCATVTNSGTLTVGQSGTGALTLTDNAVFTNSVAVIGANADSLGAVTVSDTATWTNSGGVTVGQRGTGAVTLSDHVTVTSSGAAVVGANNNSFGVITVGDDSTWTHIGNFTVGQSGTGTLTLSGNAVVSNSAAIIGDMASGVGTVSVTDSAQWRNSGTFKVGNSGTGELTISGNALVETWDTDIGYDQNANGTVNVSGSAFWQIKTDPAAGYEGALFIGHGATATDAPVGTLNITNRGSVSAGHSYVGYNASGAVTVSGSGFWHSGDLYLGAHGDGALTITDSGSVSSGVAAISDAQAGASGTVSVSDNGLWLVTGGSLLNNDGGHLLLAGSGSVNVSGTYAQNTGAALTFTLSDTSAKIVANSATVSGTLNIAGFSGTLTDKASTTMSELYTLIHTAAPGNLSGTFDEVNFVSGGLGAIPDYITSLGAFVDTVGQNYQVGFTLSWYAAQVSATNAHGTFTVADDVSFDVDVSLDDVASNPDKNWDGQSLTKNGAGTLTLSATNNYSGTTTVNAGLLNISGWTGSNAAGVIDGGAVNVSGVWSVREDITVINGALAVSGGTVNSGAALTVTNSELSVIGGVLDSPAAVVNNSVAIVSGGTWNSATLDFTGTLDVIGSGLLDTGTLTVNVDSVVNVADSGTVTSVDADVNARAVSVSEHGYLETSRLAVSDSMSVTDSGVVKSGTLTVNAAKLLLAGGAVLRADEAVVNGGTVAVVSDGVRLQNTAGTGQLTISGNGATVLFDHGGNFTFDSKVVGSANIKLASGITTFTAPDSTHSGTVSVNAGALLRAGNANVISPNADVSLAGGGAFDLNNFSQRFRNFSVSGGDIDFGGTDGTLTVSRLNGDGTWHFYADTDRGAHSIVTVSHGSNGVERVILQLAGNGTTDPAQALAGMINDPYQAVWEFDDFNWGLFDYSANYQNGALTVTRNGVTTSGAVIGSMAELQRRAWFAQQNSLLKRMGDVRLSLTPPKGDDDAANDDEAWQERLDQMFADMGVKMPPRKSVAPPLESEPRLSQSFIENVWFRAYGSQLSVGRKVAGLAYDQMLYGGDLGTDHAWRLDKRNTLLTGLYLGYGNSEADFKSGGARAELSSYYGGFYASWWNHTGWYVDATLKGALVDNQARSPLGDSTVRANFSNLELGGSVEAGKRINLGDGWFVEPQAQLNYLHLLAKDFDYGRLNISARDLDAMELRVGAMSGRTMRLSGSKLVQTYAKLSGVGEVSSGGRVSNGVQSLHANGDGLSVEIGAGLIFQIDEHNQLHFDYEAEFGEKYAKPWGLTGGYRYQF